MRDDIFHAIFNNSRSEKNRLPLFVRNSKLMEEVGEFSEALIHKAGFKQYKELKEPLEGEAADVIICILNTLICAYPELNEKELYALVNSHVEKKCKAWSDRINAPTIGYK